MYLAAFQPALSPTTLAQRTMIDQIIVVIAEFALIQVFDSPELVGNVAQPPPDVVGDVLGQVVNVADGGEALGQAEAPDRVNYVLLQSLLLLLL